MNINESLDITHPDHLPKQDNVSASLPKSHLYDDAQSAFEAARILPYAAYAWPLRGEGDFKYIDNRRPIDGALQKRCMIKVFNNILSDAHENLTHLVTSHPIGYAMAALLMLLCMTRSDEYSAHYQKLMPSIRIMNLYLGSGTTIYCRAEYPARNMALCFRIDDYTVPPAQSARLQASLADAEAILRAPHVNRVIMSDAQLEALLAASFERPA